MFKDSGLSSRPSGRYKLLMYITFIVVSYNQEMFILEALESIKYQVQKYGRHGNKYQIIITDDYSQDQTYLIESAWLKENAVLFEDAVLMPSDRNRGITQNYARSFEYIKGSYVLSVGGDDLAADADIASIPHNKDIYIGSFFQFSDAGFVMDQKCKSMQYLFWGESEYGIQKASKYLYPFYAQTWLVSSRLFKDRNVKKAMKGYKFLDDKPRWRYWLMECSPSMGFYLVPFILYRKSALSVTNRNNSVNKVLRKENKKFLKFCIYDSKTVIEKWISAMYYFSDVHPGNILFRVLNPHKYFYIGKRIIKQRKMGQLACKLDQKYYDANVKYYELIRKKAKK